MNESPQPRREMTPEEAQRHIDTAHEAMHRAHAACVAYAHRAGFTPSQVGGLMYGIHMTAAKAAEACFSKDPDFQRLKEKVDTESEIHRLMYEAGEAGKGGPT